MKNKILSVKELTLAFSGLRVIDSVSFDVERGSLFSIIGPNGAGKSSIFNCISGLYHPQEGSIHFYPEKNAAVNIDNISRTTETDISQQKSIKQQNNSPEIHDIDLLNSKAEHIAASGVGRTFQNIALFENMTVLDNLLTGRTHLINYGWLPGCLRTPAMIKTEFEHRRKVEEIIEFLNLGKFRKTPISILPYGVLKRVELGRALCMEPQMLLLDEPAAGLNREEREDMARFILDIKHMLGISQILIEHDLNFVMDLSDSIMALNFGCIIASGQPEEVRSHREVIRAYLGSESS